MRVGIRLATDSRIDCIGVRLTPAAGWVLVGDELPALVDQVVRLCRQAA
jgi:hypothetical protein